MAKITRATATRPTTTDANTDTKAATIDRIGIPITPAGAIAWDTVRASRVPQLRELILSEARQLAPAGTPAAAPAVDTEFRDTAGKWVGIMYDALASVAMSATQARTGCTPEQAQTLALTEDERDSLVPATVRLFEKYAPNLLTRFGDEAALAMAIGPILLAKTMAFRAARAVPTPRAHVLPISQAENALKDNKIS